METSKNVALVTLSTGNKHEITQETYEQITEASPDDYILLPDWTTFKKSAVMEIEPIKEPINNYPQLPAVGFNGVIKMAKKNGHIEALVRGFKKAKAKLEAQGRSTKNIDDFIQQARDLYVGKKKYFNPSYEPKYKTWEEAKAAGVV